MVVADFHTVARNSGKARQMKLSIWQQFSSNHSSMYWVVGVFDTVEQAEESFHKFWETFEGMNMHPDDIGLHTSDVSEEAIQLVGRNIILSNPDQTWMDKVPFTSALEKLGAITFGYDMNVTENDRGLPDGRLRLKAPSDAIADEIEQSLKIYFSGDMVSDENLPPWHDDETNLKKAMQNSNLILSDNLATAQKTWKTQYERYAEFPKWQMKMKRERIAAGNKSDPKMIRNGLRFAIEGLWFKNETLGVYALFAWLEVLGCTEIDYYFAEYEW
jgi:hypothetical protein